MLQELSDRELAPRPLLSGQLHHPHHHSTELDPQPDVVEAGDRILVLAARATPASSLRSAGCSCHFMPAMGRLGDVSPHARPKTSVSRTTSELDRKACTPRQGTVPSIDLKL